MTMLVLINAGNQGKPLGDTTLNEIRALGADGVRTDILPDDAEDRLREFRENEDLQLLALIHGGEMRGNEETMLAEARHAARIAQENLRMHELPKPPIFELGNEPNIKHNLWNDANRFGRAVAAASAMIWEVMPTALVVSGAIHNPGPKAQGWLRRAAAHFPRDERLAVGFHNYAPGMGDPDVPQDGFRSLDQQMAGLMNLGFPLFDTESGGHTGGREKHTEEQIAAWLKRRLDLSREWKLVGTVVFQLNDGIDPNDFESHFGLVRLNDRSWKPSGYALKEWSDAEQDRVAAAAPESHPPIPQPELPRTPAKPKRPRKRPRARRRQQT